MIENSSSFKNPLISVIIPTYNRKKMLIQSIESIEAQRYNNIEIIVVDDNSSDGTEEYFKNNNKLNITYKRNKSNKGPGYCRKLGYSISNGKFIIFMDDDDYYTDFDFFLKAINIFNTNVNNNISFVSANSEIKYEYNNSYLKKKLNISKLINQKDYLNEFQFKFNKPNSTFTTLFSKEHLELSDFSRMEMVNDSSIYLRALLSGNAYIMDEFIGVYRIHNKNISNSIQDNFLIENLEEKKYIYNQIKDKNIKLDFDNWWYKQVFITVKYFIDDTRPNIKSFLNVYSWCMNNTTSYKNKFKFSILFIGDYVFTKFKQILKKFLRRKNEVQKEYL